MTEYHAVIPVRLSARPAPGYLDGTHAGTVPVIHATRVIGRARMTTGPDSTIVTIDPSSLKADHRELIPNGYTPYLQPRLGRGPGGRPTPVLLAVDLIGTDTTGEAVELHPGSGPRPAPAPPIKPLEWWQRPPPVSVDQ